MQNVNDSYFDGHYKQVWKSLIPAELTPKEVDFMIRRFQLGPGSRVLDLLCGYGRHALALGAAGIAVTAVDNLPDYINELQLKASADNLPIQALRAEVLGFEAEGKFDLAIIMGNSLNFFGRSQAIGLLRRIAAHLTAGGQLLINTWSLAEIAIRSFSARGWTEESGVKHLSEARYLFQPTRIEYDSTFLFPDGRTEQKKAIDYIFSLAEMETLLAEAGFSLTETWSIPGKKPFALGDPRAYLVAEKT